jgi:DNA replication protein DnaC
VNCDEIGAIKDELAECATAKALVIDDAGVEDERWYSEHVATLIARRYRNALPTIVTTNLNEKDFGQRYGGRINDRLHEIGRFEIVGKSAADSLRMRMKRT